MFDIFQNKPQEFRKHYHQRSNVESVFMAIKQQFGADLSLEHEIGLQNEALCKVLCHNICTVINAMHTLNLDPEFSVEEKEDIVEKRLELSD